MEEIKGKAERPLDKILGLVIRKGGRKGRGQTGGRSPLVPSSPGGGRRTDGEELPVHGHQSQPQGTPNPSSGAGVLCVRGSLGAGGGAGASGRRGTSPEAPSGGQEASGAVDPREPHGSTVGGVQTGGGVALGQGQESANCSPQTACFCSPCCVWLPWPLGRRPVWSRSEGFLTLGRGAGLRCGSLGQRNGGASGEWTGPSCGSC